MAGVGGWVGGDGVRGGVGWVGMWPGGGLGCCAVRTGRLDSSEWLC